MNRIILIYCLLAASVSVNAQNVGVGTNTPHSSSLLELSANNKGLLIPRLSTTERLAIPTPANSLMVYDVTNDNYWYYSIYGWKPIGADIPGNSNLQYGQGPGQTYYLNTNYSIGDVYSGVLYDSGGPSGNYGNNENNTFSFNLTNTSNLGCRLEIISNVVESPYDSLLLIKTSLEGTDTINLENAPDVIYVDWNSSHSFKIVFKTNNLVPMAGFEIRWNMILANPVAQNFATPLAGWHYVPAKIAIHGGTDFNNNWSNDSTGLNAFSFGNNNQAKGDISLALGQNNKAIGYASRALGLSNVTRGFSATAIGNGCFADGMHSLAAGNQSKATGNYGLAIGAGNVADESGVALGLGDSAYSFATALGHANTSRGQYSVTAGFLNIAKESHSMALGTGNTANGYASYAIGYFNETTGYFSTAIGNYCRAVGNQSTALGIRTKATAENSFVIGIYNDTSVVNSLFEIGNGAYAANSNALTILKNGNTGIGNIDPAYKLDVVSRIRIRGLAGITAGIWLNNEGNSAIPAFIGMRDDTKVGFYGSGSPNSGWGFLMNTTNGRVGIGTDVPSEALHVVGNVYVTGSLTQNSDSRLKRDITPLNNTLSSIKALQAYRYYWNPGGPDTTEQIGFLAQELQQQFPQLVKKSDTGILSINYSGMVPVLLQAMKEQQAEIDAMKAEIKEMKKSR